MYVVKRDGRRVPVHFDKITARITKLCYGLNPDFCDPVRCSPLELVNAWPQPARLSALRLAAWRCRGAGHYFQTRLLLVRSLTPLRLPSMVRAPFLVGPQVLVAQKVTTGVYKGVTTSELDELAAETAASMTASHPDYALVSRLRWQPRPVHAVLLAMLLGLLTWCARKTTASSLHSRCS